MINPFADAIDLSIHFKPSHNLRVPIDSLTYLVSEGVWVARGSLRNEGYVKFYGKDPTIEGAVIDLSNKILAKLEENTNDE